MAGTKEGGIAARDKNYATYGKGFYRVIGAKGGALGRGGGFGAGPEGRERARRYGAIGGSVSRRGRTSTKPRKLTKDQQYENLLERFKRGDLTYLEFMAKVQEQRL